MQVRCRLEKETLEWVKTNILTVFPLLLPNFFLFIVLAFSGFFFPFVTDDLLVLVSPGRVGGRHCRAATLSVPRKLSGLGRRADANRVRRGRVAVAGAGVPLVTPVPGGPDVDAALPVASLRIKDQTTYSWRHKICNSVVKNSIGKYSSTTYLAATPAVGFSSLQFKLHDILKEALMDVAYKNLEWLTLCWSTLTILFYFISILVQPNKIS
jgi:hypothetical protein